MLTFFLLSEKEREFILLRALYHEIKLLGLGHFGCSSVDTESWWSLGGLLSGFEILVGELSFETYTQTLT